MKRALIILFFLLCHIEAYDTSFSEVIQETYAEYHQREGDWCDRLLAQVQSVVKKYGRSVSFEELQQEGIDPDYLDAMAVEYCKKYPDAYIAIIWPTLDATYEKMVYDILSKECLVAYQKTFTLKGHAPKALMQSIPEKVPHISFDFHCYFSREKSSYAMRCFVIRAPTHATTVRAKRTLRDIVKLDPYCMHISDTHDQVLDLAYMLLNNNSLHFLNFHQPQQFTNFNPLLDLYANFLTSREIPKKDVCVDGSSVLSAYGLRDCALDFDFLCTKFGDFGTIHPLDHHNLAWDKLGLPIEEVIYNPKNFFYYKGYKFASLMKIRNFKELQGRSNDLRDVALIDNNLLLN
jgi:hypothetical protein